MISTADLADTRSRKTLRPIVLVLANRPELHSGSLAGSPTKCLANAGVIMACSSQRPAYERAGHWPLPGALGRLRYRSVRVWLHRATQCP